MHAITRFPFVRGGSFMLAALFALAGSARADVPVDWHAPWPKNTHPGAADAHLSYAPGKAPASWSIATAETLMARYPDYSAAYWKPWTYVHGYAFRAFEMLYDATGDTRYLEFIRRYIDQFVDADGNFHGDQLTNLDNLMTGSSIVALYERTHDERYRKAAGQFRRAFDTYPRNTDGGFWHGTTAKGQMWIDGVFMGQMFLLRYGRSIGDTAYCNDEAAKQITIFAGHARKADSGLYYHAWTEHPELKPWADPKTGLSPEVWSEGLGWYALVLTEALATLPPEHPKRSEVLGIFRDLAAGLKRTQDPKTGGWYMIADRPDAPGNWIDPSGTGMFTAAIVRGIDLGLLSKADYAAVVARGYDALTTFARIDDQGLVDVYGGGDGIGVKKDYASYVAYPRTRSAKETVIAFLWATTLVERASLPHVASR